MATIHPIHSPFFDRVQEIDGHFAEVEGLLSAVMFLDELAQPSDLPRWREAVCELHYAIEQKTVAARKVLNAMVPAATRQDRKLREADKQGEM